MISKDLLKQILLDNRREIERYNIVHRDIVAEGFNCYVFVGVRRAGKSYVLYEKMQQLLREGHGWEEMLYLSFEDERLVGFASEDFNAILECHIEMTGNDNPMLFFDEIHNIDGWEKFARRMADSKKTVWITGSNAKMLSKEIMTTLGGRYIPIEVYPFSFREYLRSRGIPYDEPTLMSTTGKSLFMREYAEYINWGGLPESVNLNVKRSYLSSVYQKIYLGDICARNNISNPNLLRLMIKKMAESVKQPLSYSRVTKILSSVGGKITIPTTSSYIEYCEDAWLLLRLHNINAAFAERETNSKYYFIDNGLLSLLLTDPTTTLLENIVAVSLFRKYGNSNDGERVFFYKQNVEVDFYIPDDELAIQVSYSIEESDMTEKREVEALKKLPKALSCKRRLIITYDEEKTIEDEYGVIEVIPCWKWLISR
ncbi:MAG: ATP-binding protein [Muribaculaceae bacterium]|nr:ATP-binding protein [Muribaculaceae bacterium]